MENDGIVIVGSEENPASVTSTGGPGIWTRRGSHTGKITVYGDVTGSTRGIFSAGYIDIKVYGDVKSTSTLGYMCGVDASAGYEEEIIIDIEGNVEGPNGVKFSSSNGGISVKGNILANGSYSNSTGICI